MLGVKTIEYQNKYFVHVPPRTSYSTNHADSPHVTAGFTLWILPGELFSEPLNHHHLKKKGNNDLSPYIIQGYSGKDTYICRVRNTLRGKGERKKYIFRSTSANSAATATYNPHRPLRLPLTLLLSVNIFSPGLRNLSKVQILRSIRKRGYLNCLK